MQDKYGTKIIGIMQYKAISTEPNTGTMPDCFTGRTVYTYHLINSNMVHCSCLEMDVIQADNYVKENNLRIIKDW